MTKKTMLGIEVFLNEDYGISIRQTCNNDIDTISVHPSQVPILIEWILEAAKEIEELDLKEATP